MTEIFKHFTKCLSTYFACNIYTNQNSELYTNENIDMAVDFRNLTLPILFPCYIVGYQPLEPFKNKTHLMTLNQHK